MADHEDAKADASAEKAYAAAVEATPAIADDDAQAELPAELSEAVDSPAPSPDDAPAAPQMTVTGVPAVEFPARATRAAKAATTPATASAKVDTVKPSKSAKARSVVAAAKPRRVPAPAKIPGKPLAVKRAPAVAPKPFTPIKHKESPMENKDYAEGVQKVAASAQAKARQAFAKGSALFGEYRGFAKGNVDAMMESSKILAAGLQGMATTMVADGKVAVETAAADVKLLAGVKSPGDLFKLQADLAKRNFDSAVAVTTRNTETALKLAKDVFAPISGRVTLAVEKLKTAA